MEKNKSIDGLRTHADKNPESANIDGLRSRSAQPVFKTAKIKKPSMAKPSLKKEMTNKPPKQKVNTPQKAASPKHTVKATLVPTKDEDLLAAFSGEPNDTSEAEKKLQKVSESFIEPTEAFDDTDDDRLSAALSETVENEDNDEAFVPDIIDKKPITKEEKKALKAKKKAEKEAKKAKNKDVKLEETKGSLLDEDTPKPKKKVSVVRRVITTVILILVLGTIGVVTWAVFWGNDIIAKITGGRGNVFDVVGALLSGDTYEPLKTDSNRRTNILAFGTSGWNMEGDEGNGVHDGAQLTDSIMAISINQETGDVAMISLPRDLKASPTCTATGKINEVYWCNNMYGDAEETGAQAIMNEVGGILGMEFQYFVHINWGSLVSVVNTLGGIKVTLDEDIADYGWTNAVFEAGVEYTIDGEQALGLARARHGTALGDFTRGNSQQKILIGIKDRIYEKNISLTDALSLVSSLGDNLRTNLSVSEIKTAIHLTFEFDFEAMRQLSLMDYDNGNVFMTFANINGISYVVPAAGVGNYNPIREFVKLNLNNDPVVREQARVIILNGSDAVGVAADERDKLRVEEYNIVNIDNIGGNWEEGYHIFFTDKKFAGTVEALEKRYGSIANEHFPEGIDGSQADVVVIIGGAREEAGEE